MAQQSSVEVIDNNIAAKALVSAYSVNSPKGDFTLNVDFVGILEKSRIPFIYIVNQESTITTTDQAAVQCITGALMKGPLPMTGETMHAVLVQANETRWLLFGRKERDEAGTDVLKIKARMLSGHALAGWTRPQLHDDRSVFLTKKVRSALDDHQKSSKRVKLSPKLSRRASSGIDPRQSSTARTSDESKTAALEGATNKDRPKPTRRRTKDAIAKPPPALLKEQSSIDPRETTAQGSEKAVRDKLKKMIITLLSLRGITKTNEDFKGLYNNTLQAATFALRFTSTTDIVLWEERAMAINESLLKLFLEPV